MTKYRVVAALALVLGACSAANDRGQKRWFDGRLRIDSPAEGDEVKRTFTISGQAQGWFEGNIPVAVYDYRGNRLYSGNFTVRDNYDRPVKFQEEITFESAPGTANVWIEFTEHSAKDGSVVYRRVVHVRVRGGGA